MILGVLGHDGLWDPLVHLVLSTRLFMSLSMVCFRRVCSGDSMASVLRVRDFDYKYIYTPLLVSSALVHKLNTFRYLELESCLRFRGKVEPIPDFSSANISRTALLYEGIKPNVRFSCSLKSCLLWRLLVDFFLEVLPTVGARVQCGQTGEERLGVVLSALRRLLRVVRRGCVQLADPYMVSKEIARKKNAGARKTKR